jgi:hypothetical protein
MAKSQSSSRGFSPLDIQVELLESRWLLSGLGHGQSLPGPFLPPAEFSGVLPVSSMPTNFEPTVAPGIRAAQDPSIVGDSDPPPERVHSTPRFAESSVSPSSGALNRSRAVDDSSGTEPPPLAGATASGSAAPTAATPGATAAPMAGDGAMPVIPGRGAGTYGREVAATRVSDAAARVSDEAGSPRGGPDGAGRAYGLAVVQGHAAAAVEGEDRDARPNVSGSGNAQLPAGLLMEAKAIGPFASEVTRDVSPAFNPGGSPIGPASPRVTPGSFAPPSDRLGSESHTRVALLRPGLPSRFEWGQPDDDPLGMPTIPMTAPSDREVQDSPGASRIADRIPARSGVLADESSGVPRLTRGSGGLIPGSALRSTRLRGELSPEAIDLEADPAPSSFRDLLRELEKLRDQMESAGETAIGWLFDRKISELLLLAIVVAVTVEITRRELWYAEVYPPAVDGEGFPVPRMV